MPETAEAIQYDPSAEKPEVKPVAAANKESGETSNTPRPEKTFPFKKFYNKIKEIGKIFGGRKALEGIIQGPEEAPVAIPEVIMPANDYKNTIAEGVSTAAELLPIAGTAKPLVEAATGKDMVTGDPVNPYTRIVDAALNTIPVVGPARKVEKGFELAKKGIKLADKTQDNTDKITQYPDNDNIPNKDQQHIEHIDKVDKTIKPDQADLEKQQLREFTKRYSPLEREQLAHKIQTLRKLHQAGEKPEPSHDETRKLDYREADLEDTRGKITQIEQELSEATTSLQERKSRVWYRLTDRFTGGDNELLDKIKTGTASKEELEKDASERLKLITEMRMSIEDASYSDEAKKALGKFYEEQSGLKSNFEKDIEERDIQNIFKKHKLVFAHGMSPRGHLMARNAISEQGFGSLETRIDLIAGFEPTISAVALPIEDDAIKSKNSMIGRTGALLYGGTLLDIGAQDIGSSPMNLYTRVPRTDQSSGIHQPDIKKHIQEQVDKIRSGDVNLYSEAIIESPKIGALYYIDTGEPLISKADFTAKFEAEGGKSKFGMDVDSYAQVSEAFFSEDVQTLQIEAEKLDVPFLKFRQPTETSDTVANIDTNTFFGQEEISQGKKLDLVTDVIEKNPFHINSSDKQLFDAMKEGESRYITSKNGISSIEYAERNIEASQRQIDIMSQDQINQSIDRATWMEGQIKGTKKIKEKTRYELYGIARAAEKAGDSEINQNALQVLRKNFQEVQGEDPVVSMGKWYQEHVDENGEYRMRESDIPFDVRTRAEELKKSD